MDKVALSLGSNIGNKSENLDAALASISDLPTTQVVSASGFYQTAPWGDNDQDWFLNAAAVIETDLAPLDLLKAIKTIEADLGRTKTRRWGPRVIDIDILAHGSVTMQSDQLSIPHIQLIHRAFVLVPLMEIWPDLTVNGEDLAAHLARLERTPGDVEPFQGDG
ncbi:MAG: 2-amino-4-hydroxy-6-hydroxymethyldihydropteridine diphosphokinase [Pseudomonadota bacterium]